MATNLTRRVDVFLNLKGADRSLQEVTRESRKLFNELRQLPRGSQEFIDKSKRLREVRSELDLIKKEAFGAQRGFLGMGQSAGSVLKGMLGFGAITSILSGIQGAIGGIFRLTAQHESALASLSAITGAAGEDLEFLNAASKRTGATHTVTATEILEAYKLMASARPELLKNKEALAQVTEQAITLAEASGEELGPTIDGLGKILNIYTSLGGDAARVTNAQAAASKEGAAGVRLQTESLLEFAPAAESFNVSLEQSLGLVETLAENGFEGARAGTALRAVLDRMQNIEVLPPKALADLERMGVNIELVSDKTVPFQDRLEEMAKIQDDGAALTHVFGQEHSIAGRIILGNTERVEEFTKAVTGTNTAQEQASKNNATLAASYEILKGNLETLAINIGSFLSKAVKPLIDGLNWLLGPTKDYSNGLRDQEAQLRKTQSQFNAKAELLKTLTKEQGGLNTMLEDENDLGDKAIPVREQLAKKDDERNRLIKEMNEVYGDYLPQQIEEGDNLKRIATLQQQANDKFMESIKMKANEARLTEIENQLVEKQIALDEHRLAQQISKEKEAAIRAKNARDVTTQERRSLGSNTSKRNAAFLGDEREMNHEIEKLMSERQRILDAGGVLPGSDDGDEEDDTPSGGGGESAAERERKRQEAQLEELERGLQKYRETLDEAAEDRYQDVLSEKDRKLRQIQVEFDEQVAGLDQHEKMVQEMEFLSEEERLAKLEEIATLRRNLLRNRQAEELAIETEWQEKKAETEAEIQDVLLEGQMDEQAQELAAVDEKYDALVKKAESFGLSTAAIEEARLAERRTVQQKYQQQELEDWDVNLAAKAQLLSDFRSSVDNLMTAAGETQTEYMAFYKLLTLSQIAIDTGRAISSVITAAASSSITPLDLALKIGTGIATVTANFLSATQLVTGAEPPAPPAFAEGGYTYGGSIAGGGMVRRGMLATVAERGPEYVIPHHLLAVPDIARTVSRIESVRTGRTRGYAEGGMTGGASVPAITSTDPQLVAALNRIAMTNEALIEQLRFGVNVSVDKVNDAQEKLARYKKRGQL